MVGITALVCLTLGTGVGKTVFVRYVAIQHWVNLRVFIIIIIIIIIINSLTAKVVGAPQMILQPVFSIFPCSPLPSWTCRTQGLSIP